MATITIGKSYFEALLRRTESVSKNPDTSSSPGPHGVADFHRQHTSTQQVNYATDLSNNVTISKAEYEFLIQLVREYQLLKRGLFRNGLSAETFETLLQDENGATSEAPLAYDYDSEHIPARTQAAAEAGTTPFRYLRSSDNTAVSYGLQARATSQLVPRVVNHGEHETFMDGLDSSPDDDDSHQEHAQRIPLHDQRTLLITNLAERTTHKDLANIIRGGRLLEIFIRRHDRSATISFVEGAAEFLAYTKRNDIYLHMKRLEFRWSDRQFHVPAHVSNKIVNGATRNLVVRGVAAKATTDQIRDHLDHIHNLVIVDIYFQNGDAYISMNSIHNALFARTCMMSRTAYKGSHIVYYPDECAEPLPRPTKTQPPVPRVPKKPMPVVNQYALLDTGSDDDAQSDEESYRTNGVKIDGYHWADSVVA